ncbi:MAG: hypothetical protein ACP5O1_06950 [Phycisphaerae bacterium]
MELINPIWLIFPIAATLVAMLLMLLATRRQRVVPFSALHWLRPMDRTPRWAFFSRPPIILTLLAASLVTGAVGTLRWHLIRSAESTHPIHIWFSMRRIKRREFAYMRITAHAGPQKFKLTGLGRRRAISRNRLRKGVIISLPPDFHPNDVTLSIPGKIIWQTHITPNVFRRTLRVDCSPDVPHVLLRVLKSITWVHMSRRLPNSALFVGYHRLPHMAMNQLILSGPGRPSPIPSASPVILAPDASVLSNVTFRGVEVRRMVFMAPPAGWQTLVAVNGHPWILLWHHGSRNDWRITSDLTTACTNWSRFASFVIFIANCAGISSGDSPGPRFWLVQTIVPSGPTAMSADHRKLPEIGQLFEMVAAALTLAALVCVIRRIPTGGKNTDAHPDAQTPADHTARS